ncbi:MAG TPA: Rrf2 family transcriptional regulator [Fimbriimonas sp.]|nr:Rrf2 family transcriptional regulator [Fimbriimonas sp.]
MLSSRARYATRALLDLSIRYENGTTQIQDIAERQNIPFKYLQQILMSLKVAGFVQSRKGPGGGYTLSMPPNEITLAAVLRAMDGPLAPISCVSVTSYSECGCPKPETCALKNAFRDVREAMVEVLEKTSFADLRDRQNKADADFANEFNFVI